MKKTLFIIYLILLSLLALTTATAFVPLGVWNAILNFGIAVAKALLIIIFFMQVRFASKPVLIFVCVGFVWLTFFIAITLGDYLTRGQLNVYGK